MLIIRNSIHIIYFYNDTSLVRHPQQFSFLLQPRWRSVSLTSCQSSGSISSTSWGRAFSCEGSLRSCKRSYNLLPPAAPGCLQHTCGQNQHTVSAVSWYTETHYSAEFYCFDTNSINANVSQHVAFHLNFSNLISIIRQTQSILQEEILHDVCVILTAAVREVAGCKYNDGIQTLAIITWKRMEMIDSGSLFQWLSFMNSVRLHSCGCQLATS